MGIIIMDRLFVLWLSLHYDTNWFPFLESQALSKMAIRHNLGSELELWEGSFSVCNNVVIIHICFKYWLLFPSGELGMSNVICFNVSHILAEIAENHNFLFINFHLRLVWCTTSSCSVSTLRFVDWRIVHEAQFRAMAWESKKMEYRGKMEEKLKERIGFLRDKLVQGIDVDKLVAIIKRDQLLPHDRIAEIDKQTTAGKLDKLVDEIVTAKDGVYSKLLSAVEQTQQCRFMYGVPSNSPAYVHRTPPVLTGTSANIRTMCE